VRVEVGPRDLATDTVTVVRRLADGAKERIALAGLADVLSAAMADDQESMLTVARATSTARTTAVSSVVAAIDAAATGWASLPYDVVGEAGEDALGAGGRIGARGRRRDRPGRLRRTVVLSRPGP
jgi:prolyl-tRNA synthetase